MLEEPIEDTHFSIDVYEESGNIYVVDLYLISNIGEGDDKLASQIIMLNTSGILSFGRADCPPHLFNQYVHPFNP